MYRKKYYIWNPSTCGCENNECLGSILNDLTVTCDDILEPTKNTTRNFDNKKATCKIDNLYNLLGFLLTTMLLLIMITFYYYYYHTKHQPEQKHVTIVIT